MRLLILLAILLQPLCGEVAGPGARRIAGGVDADPLLYPFVVRIRVSASPPTVCTGTLLSSEWVLTAAHCVDGHAASQWLTFCRSDVDVLHGGVDRIACEIQIHDLYDPFTPEGRTHDLALLRIQPFVGRTHRPVQLGQTAPAVGTRTWTAGMGTDRLSAIKVAQWRVIACPDNYPAGWLCTHASAGVIAELGDSGGPLLVQQDSEWRQVGLVARVNDTNRVIAYPDLPGHAEWIRSVAGLPSADQQPPPADDPAPVPPADACPVEPVPSVVLEWRDGEWRVRLEPAP